MDKRTRGYLFEDRGRVVRGELSRGRIVRRKIDSCLLILTEESYINKESEKKLRSRYDQFISICCCGIESVRSKVVSFDSSFDRN